MTSPNAKRAREEAARKADRYISKDGSTPDLSRLDTLGTLSPVEYGTRRDDLAEEMGTSLKFLDEEYKERRKRGKRTAATMRADWHVEAWPDEVPGGYLLEQMVRRIRRHVVMDEEAALAVALWVMFAWMHEAAVHSPILMGAAPRPNAAKLRYSASPISWSREASFSLRSVPPLPHGRNVNWTLLVDEADRAFRPNPRANARPRQTPGWTRGWTPRCHHETNEPEFFETFGPKAIGLKGLNVPDTTLSRSIIIDMQRKLPAEQRQKILPTTNQQSFLR